MQTSMILKYEPTSSAVDHGLVVEILIEVPEINL